MDKAPLVSVVVPVYNSEAWIDDCVGSLLSQSFGDWELILVDDCSTDGSLARCEAYEGDDRVRVVSRPVGGGAGAARNTGLAAACGTYVYFLDSDDMLVEESLQVMVDVVESHGLDALFFGAKVLCEDDALADRVAGYESYYSRPAEEFFEASGGDMLSFMVEQGKFVATPGLQLYRRKKLLDAGISYPEGIIYEDNLFTIEACLAAERVGMVPDKLFVRRLRAGSLMTSEHQLMRYFRSNFTLAAAILGLASVYEGSQRVRHALLEREANFAKLAYADYLNLKKQGGAVDLSWMDHRQRALFDAFYLPYALQAEELDRLERELAESEERERLLREELKGVYGSKTFKAGNVVVALPRAIKHALGR